MVAGGVSRRRFLIICLAGRERNKKGSIIQQLKMFGTWPQTVLFPGVLYCAR